MAHFRKYEVREDFFDKWSHDMAYILGFISADGSISKEKTSLAIELQKRDIGVLKFIKSKVSPQSKITTRTVKGRNYVRLRINSIKLVESLQQYNVIPNKTFSIRIDFDIPKRFRGDYIRGVFDGDGWVYCRRNGIEAGVVSGSKLFINDLQILSRGIGRVRVRTRSGKQHSPQHIWDLSGKSVMQLRDLMHANGGFSLKRKKDILFSNFYVPSNRWWTDEQLQFLKDNYVPKTDGMLKFIAAKTGKSYRAVSKKVWEIGLAAK